MSRLPSPIYLQGELIGAGSKGPESKNISRRKLIAFGWYGGKYSHLGWLLPLLPESHHYCEPFAGSAAVLLNRRPSPVETYNDIDGEIANFFRVLRDRTEDLGKAHSTSLPFSREEFYWAVSEGTEHLDEFRAREKVLHTCPPVQNGVGPDRLPGSLGQLQEHEQGGDVRGSLTLAR